MSIDHSGFNILVTEKLLHLSYIDAVLKQVRRKAVAQGVNGGVLCNTGFLHGIFQCRLYRRVADVMAPDSVAPRIDRKGRSRKRKSLKSSDIIASIRFPPVSAK